MNRELIKARLNLHAVLVNLEDLVRYDAEMAGLTRDWDVSIQFSVLNGPSAHVRFKDGTCTVGKGRMKRPSVKLFFFSPAHMNRMFDGKAQPVLLKGFTRLGFLTKDFPKLTEKLGYYLKPTQELLKNKKYVEMNTRFTLTTAVFAVPVLGELDPVGRLNAEHIRDGILVVKILPDGPAAYLDIKHGSMETMKGSVDRPMAAMLFRDVKAASDLFNQKTDGFSAIASGGVVMRGHIDMIDAMTMILDRIPVYLQ
jgi:hypothetical protein